MSLRNIAIIAHVDHGKTTLVDQMLRQSGAFRANQQVVERALDSNELERERGITILAKCTSLVWGKTRINIVDTPGHADFGGEVERILSMVDGALLLVDAAEGPMPQTKFVTAKALAMGLSPIVVINKMDRPDARAHEVHEAVFDLFAALGADNKQMDFPVLYACGRDGWASASPDKPGTDLAPLFELILRHVPEPATTGHAEAPFVMLATTLEADAHLGRLLTGRIESGRIAPNRTIKALSRTGALVERARVTKVIAFRGLNRIGLQEAEAGDIVAIAGLSSASVADTLCDLDVETPVPAPPIDPPTLAVTIEVNDSPLAGTEGGKVQSRVIRERLFREAQGNVAIRVAEAGEKAFEVAGRGELQLGVLIETMRREGFELAVSRPRVLYKTDPETGARLEPIEDVQIDLDDAFVGIVIDKLNQRKGELMDMRPSGPGKTRLVMRVPSRGLIGYHGTFLTDTRGTGIMNRLFHGYEPHRGPIEGRRNGVLISTDHGDAVAYALWYLEERGVMFIDPGTRVYEGMIIGENARPDDLDVNPLKTKHLTNIRTTSKDEAIRLTPPRKLTLEDAIAYIGEDELVEVTPQSIRLRKRLLKPHLRKRRAKAEVS
jgi:GTP-binding protein